MPFKFPKPHKSPKEAHTSEEIHISEEHTISILRIDLAGRSERTETSYFRNAPSHTFNEHEYHIPPLLMEKAQQNLANKIRLLTLEFTKDYIPIHQKDSPVQQALCGVYCIWYFPTEDRPKTAKEYIDAEGESWIVRQLQWRPEVGEMVVYEDVPVGMEEAMEGWWGKGVVVPTMKRAILGAS